MILRWALVFLAVAAADVCWARYTSHASSGRRWHAALWGVGIYLGAFVGTAVGVKPKAY
jgi:hypothetical protein